MHLESTLVLASVASAQMTTVALTTVTVYVPTSNTSVVFTDTDTLAPSTVESSSVQVPTTTEENTVQVPTTIDESTISSISSISPTADGNGIGNTSLQVTTTDQETPTVGGSVPLVTTVSSLVQSESSVDDGTLTTIAGPSSAGFSLGPWITSNGTLSRGTPTPTTMESTVTANDDASSTGKASTTSANGAQQTSFIDRGALLAAVAFLLPALAL